MLERLTTEARNPASENLDALSAIEIVNLINREDASVAGAVATQSAVIASAIELIADRLRSGGRLLYLGAGTSGRLGVLDAAECPPTFDSDPQQVVGVIAGGSTALVRAVEGAEDDPQQGERDLSERQLHRRDVVVGIATSGRTPYVIGGLRYAQRIGAATIGLVCNHDSELESVVQLTIAPVVGPEVLSGSTRMKAGTATKMVLNMLTTGTMVLLGKTYGNLMVDLRATNSKLVNRACRLVRHFTGLSQAEAEATLQESGGDLKTAIVVARCGLTPEASQALLAQHGGQLRRALESHAAGSSSKLNSPT